MPKSLISLAITKQYSGPFTKREILEQLSSTHPLKGVDNFTQGEEDEGTTLVGRLKVFCSLTKANRGTNLLFPAIDYISFYLRQFVPKKEEMGIDPDYHMSNPFASAKIVRSNGKYIWEVDTIWD